MNVVLASGDAQTVSGSHSDFIQSHFERSHSTLDLNNQKVENLWGNFGGQVVEMASGAVYDLFCRLERP